MSEKSMRRRVVKVLRSLDAVSVENMVGEGTPDVNFIGGWVELKQVERWPPRGGPLRIPHFEPQQRAWARRRARRGGRVYLLLRVHRDWLLFEGGWASEHLGHVVQAVLEENAIAHWRGNLDEASLVKWLSN